MEDDPVRASSARSHINDCGRFHTQNRWHSCGQRATSTFLSYYIVGGGLGGFTYVPYQGGQPSLMIASQSVPIERGGVLQDEKEASLSPSPPYSCVKLCPSLLCAGHAVCAQLRRVLQLPPGRVARWAGPPWSCPPGQQGHTQSTRTGPIFTCALHGSARRQIQH